MPQTLPSTKSVLIVEDEPEFAELLSLHLERAGYAARSVHNGRDALAIATREPPDLILLDVMLPELSGTEVASRLRSNPATAEIPIIMVTAKSEEVDEIVGLTVGADDYVSKPVSMKVLLARVEAVLRRGSAARDSGGRAFTLGPIEIDEDTHRAAVHGETIKLTLTEFRLLSSLVQADGKVLSRADLMTKAMGPDVLVTQRTIDVHITAIRRKLGDVGNMVQTVRGVGYRIALEPGVTTAD
ncbi:MAG: response regulator [Planctomycetota bacterium]